MNRMKLLLKELDMTQEELSFLTGIAQSEISKLANEKKRDIHLETAAKIARAFGKPIEYVFPDY